MTGKRRKSMSEIKDYMIQDILDTKKYLSKIQRGGLSDFAPAIITCAITGMQQSKKNNPYLPVTPDEQVETCIGAYEAGAAMCHIHARNPKNWDAPAQDPEDFYQINKRVREACPDLIINNTVGGGYLRTHGTGSLGVLCDIAATSKAEVATVDVEGMPAGVIGGPNVAYTITKGEMDELVTKLIENGTKPEFECFDIGDILMVNDMIATGKLGDGPFLVDLIVNPTCNFQTVSYIVEAMKYMPDNAVVSLLPTGAAQFPLLAVGLTLGLNIRVGMEDNIYLSRGVKAETNAQLVKKAVALCEMLGRPVATPEQARQMMGLGQPRVYE